VLELAKVADECGFDGLWVGEHILNPVDYGSDHPSEDGGVELARPVIDKSTELIDPLVTFGAVAAATARLRIATGVYLVPLRHPLATARVTSTLQALAGGRFLLGVGAGWLREEFDVLGIPFAERIGRLEEALDILRKAWSAEEFSYDGRYFSFDTVQMNSEPVAVPVVMGGNGPKALARAARMGDGWFASGTPTFDEAVALHSDVSRLRAMHEDLPPLQCFVRTNGSSRRDVERYAEAGFDNVVIWADRLWVGRSLEERTAHLRDSAERLGLARSK
ncbi:TIGR03619 family F420-dependent LLM class oxidoreductase, partial [Georgenia ruanii]|nr:TIGR03619 family F420-dependent LLM class oxidoreductase [Georgenia ruanii]